MNDDWAGKPCIHVRMWPLRIDRQLEWKQRFANDVYFMPMFDETDGYYEADEGVSPFTVNSTCKCLVGLTSM